MKAGQTVHSDRLEARTAVCSGTDLKQSRKDFQVPKNQYYADYLLYQSTVKLVASNFKVTMRTSQKPKSCRSVGILSRVSGIV